MISLSSWPLAASAGAGMVISLAQYGHHPGLLLDGIVVLADAETVRAKAGDKYVDKTVLRQLKGADLIVLNKIDLIAEDRLPALATWLQEVSPRAHPIVRTTFRPKCQWRRCSASARMDQLPTWRCATQDMKVLRHLASPSSPSEVTRPSISTSFLAALPRGRPAWQRICSCRRNADGGEQLLYQQVGQRVTLTPWLEAKGADDVRDGIGHLVLIGLAHDLDTRAARRPRGAIPQLIHVYSPAVPRLRGSGGEFMADAVTSDRSQMPARVRPAHPCAKWR